MPPERILIVRQGSDWDDDVPGLLRRSGYTVNGPIDDPDTVIDTVNQDLSLVPDLVLVQAKNPGPCNWWLPRFFWENHQVPTVVITSSELLPDNISLAAKSGVFATLRHPVQDADLLLSFPMVWSHHKTTIELQSKVERLELTVAARKLIEQAKWMLVESEGLSESEAHTSLQKEARSRRLKLVDVAREMVGETATDAAE